MLQVSRNEKEVQDMGFLMFLCTELGLDFGTLGLEVSTAKQVSKMFVHVQSWAEEVGAFQKTQLFGPPFKGLVCAETGGFDEFDGAFSSSFLKLVSICFVLKV